MAFKLREPSPSYMYSNMVQSQVRLDDLFKDMES